MMNEKPRFPLGSPTSTIWRADQATSIEGILAMIAFLATVSIFPSGGLLTKGGLTDFWTIPTVFYGAALFAAHVCKSGTKISPWLASMYSGLAGGTWLGLSFGAVLILNKWYMTPTVETWEPLFTATTLSSAGVLAAKKWFRSHVGVERNDEGTRGDI